MTPGKFDFNMYRGDSYAWKFVLWEDSEKTIPVDLTGATIKLEVRDKSGGIVLLTMPCTVTLPNSIDVAMTPAMYTGVPAKGVWDLQITLANTQVHTPIGGSMNITPDITDSEVVVQRMAVRK